MLDLGAQANHISNQARIYTLRAEAHSRLNTAYMMAFILGRFIRVLRGEPGLGAEGWPGVCPVGSSLLAVGLAGFAATSPGRRGRPAPGVAASPD